MTGQAYTRSLGCGARSSGLVRVLDGLVFLPARSVSPGEARARNVLSWLGAWKRVEQAIPEPRVGWIWQQQPIWHGTVSMNRVEAMALSLLGRTTVTASLRHVVTHAVEGGLWMAIPVD